MSRLPSKFIIVCRCLAVNQGESVLAIARAQSLHPVAIQSRHEIQDTCADPCEFDARSDL